MSITDIQRAFVRGLEGRAACRMATLDLEDGGRLQRLSFHVVSGSYGAALLSELIGADLCPMQHARTMAANYLEGRISGQSHYTAPPPQAWPVAPGVPLPAPVPVAIPPPAPTPVAASVHQAAPPPSTAPAAALTQGLTDELAVLDRMSREGDIAGGIDLVCRWIDDEAEMVRGVVTPGQTLEYEQIRREINDLAYGQVTATPAECPNLWASVGVDVAKTGDDAADIRAAAALINSRVDRMNDFLSRVRGVRIASKQAARAAGSIEGALAVYHRIGWPVA